MARLTPAIAVLAVLTGACYGPPEGARDQGVWGDTEVVEELRIGVESGADEYMFGAIRAIGVGPDGAIYVSDSQLGAVRMYDSNGVFVRDIGRQGQGPGEFASAPGLAVLPDGRLVTRDSRNSRVSFFSATGEYRDGFPVVAGVRTLIVDQQGDIWVEAAEGGTRLVRYSSDGQLVDNVTLPQRDRAGAQTFGLGFGEGDIYPFPTETHSAWSPLGYVVTGRNDVYDVEVRRPDGTVHLTREIAPVPVGAEEHAEWEAFRQTLVERNRERGGDSVYEPIPDVKPFFRQIFVGDDGRIWIFRYVAAQKRNDIEPLPDRPERPLLTWREPWTYDVFEPDGTFLGSVVVPELFRPYVLRGEHMWGLHTDKEGVERVLRLRVNTESS